jgi:PTH1 family peptidyl-tRNA hydrolase
MEQTETTKCVVGLGNPGRQYAQTRHNVGFMVVQELLRRWQGPAGQNVFGSRFYCVRQAKGDLRCRVMLLEPQTFMNCSGQAVRQMTDFYKVPPEDVLIVLDDMALPLGQLRARHEGSAGGHNGLSDIVLAMGTKAVPRLRIGIGQPPGRMDWKDYVLTSFGRDELEEVGSAIQLAAQAVEDWIFAGLDVVMKKYNSKVER